MPSHLFRLATCLSDVGDAPKCLFGVLTHIHSREYTMAVEQATLSLMEERCQMQNPQSMSDTSLSNLFTREELLARVQMQNPHVSERSRVFQAFFKRYGYTFFESRSRESRNGKMRPRKKKLPRNEEIS